MLDIGNTLYILSNLVKRKVALTIARYVLNEEESRLNNCFSNSDVGFHDVLSNERTSGVMREHNRLNGWSSDEREWNENLYPVWKRGDPRWNDSWKGKSTTQPKQLPLPV